MFDDDFLMALQGPSNVKLMMFGEQLAALPDDELAQALPVGSPMGVRMALGALASKAPSMNPAELDDHLAGIAQLVLALRSDDAPAIALALIGSEAQEAPAS